MPKKMFRSVLDDGKVHTLTDVLELDDGNVREKTLRRIPKPLPLRELEVRDGGAGARERPSEGFFHRRIRHLHRERAARWGA